MKNTYLAGMLAGFFGGLLGAYVLGHLDRGSALPPPRLVASTLEQHIVSADRIQLIDAGGKLRAELAMSGDGGPALFFYDSAGRNRLVLGLYSPAESEYPFVVLNDTQQHAAGIFRLFSAHETPVVVLKNQGRDRSIYGLNPSSTEPFLVNYSNDGKKSEVFGNF
ncbi:MAG TPA: hypothetical protein VK460_08140 [Burkholderiales bacterium]|nr:hypothetical protein [Burkholderiales bacterium]